MVMASKVKRHALMALVFLGVLPLPILAYALGVSIVTRGSSAHILVGQLLLLTVLLLACAGGFVIWRTVVSLTRVMGDEAEARNPGAALGEYREQRGPLTNSVARMLATIERQRKELEQFAQRLDRVNRELESTKNRLGEVSFTDDVTGLPDGRAFSVDLEEEIARCRRFDHPLSLVLLDLDDFTSINAELSREGTDEMLRGVAQFLLRSSRTVDIVCRYGTGEFAILLVETGRTGAQLYAERIGDTLSTASFGHGRKVTASLGVSSLGDGAATGDELVRGAREALRAAKRAGQNSVAVWAGSGVGCRSEPQVRAT